MTAGTATALTDVLDRAGVTVTEDAFAALVAAALAEFGAAGTSDPAAGLTESDTAALRDLGADLRPRGRREADPRAAAAAGYAALLAESLPAAVAARQMGVDASRVRHRLADRRLIGIRRPTGWLLPSYQFDSAGQPLPGIAEVAAALPAQVHPVTTARLLVTVTPDLVVDGTAVSPLAWLAGGGDPGAVVELVAALDVAL